MDTISSETVHSISGILIWLPMLIILPLIALGIYILFERNGRMFRMGMKIPGPPPVPVFGNALMAVGKSNTGNSHWFILLSILISYPLLILQIS